MPGIKMKNLYMLLPLLFILVTSACSNEQDPTIYIYADPSYSSCLDNEESILSSSGSNDAPILSIGRGIESGDVSLSWTSIPGTDFYDLEECYCPDFTSEIYSYQLTENYLQVDWRTPTYFRIRASKSGTLTGWSNVKKNYH
jgi:hypothetical protein